MSKTEQKIIRFIDAEIRAADNSEMIVEGYAIKFDKETRIGGKYGFIEKVARGALTGADLSETIFSKNHEKNPFASISNRSLEIMEDEIGIKIRANIIDTAAGIDLYKEIKSGLISRMSWLASVIDDEWTYAKTANGVDHRVIKRFGKMLDVSAVAFPAYQDTLIIARDADNAMRENQIYHRQIQKLDKILGGIK